MKRTLLALALLLGTSGAFAQIGIKADALKVTPKTSVERSEIYQHVEKQKQNNGRKDLNVTAFCDFSDASNLF
jgi:sRNA-binding carbon storage regulator CsrA